VSYIINDVLARHRVRAHQRSSRSHFESISVG
jgi:hypothetical protein